MMKAEVCLSHRVRTQSAGRHETGVLHVDEKQQRDIRQPQALEAEKQQPCPLVQQQGWGALMRS